MANSVKKDEIQSQLVSRFEYANRYRQENYDDAAVRYYKSYIGYRKEYEKDEPNYGRSNLHIPKTYELVDTFRARLFKTFCSTRPYIDMIPLPSNIHDASTMASGDKADRATALIDQQMERNQWELRMYEHITAMMIYPAAIMSVGWRYEEKQVRRRVAKPVTVKDDDGNPLWTGKMKMVIEDTSLVEWDDNELQYVDFFDFWRDPRGRGVDIDTDRFCFNREWMTEEELREYLTILKQQDAGKVWMPKFKDLRETSSGREEGRWYRQSQVGIGPEEDVGTWQEYEAKAGYLYEVLRYWTNDKHGLLINGIEAAYYGDNPYWRHRKKPFVYSVFEPLPGEIAGMCGVQVIEHLQEELNTQRNQRIDAGSFALNKQFWVTKEDMDESELISVPNGLVHGGKFGEDFGLIDAGDVHGGSYVDEEMVVQDMEAALSAPPVVTGKNTKKQQTATETQQMASGAANRMDAKIKLFEMFGIKRTAYLMDCNNQQFINTSRLAKRFGVEGPAAWMEVQPSDIIGEYEYRPSGTQTDPVANKEARRNQLLQLQTVMQNNPYINQDELTKMLVESFDIRNPEKILKSKEQLQQEQQAAAAQKGQPAGQPGQPGPGQQPPGAQAGQPQGQFPQTI